MVQETGALNSVPAAVSCLPPLQEICDFECVCMCVCVCVSKGKESVWCPGYVWDVRLMIPIEHNSGTPIALQQTINQRVVVVLLLYVT